MKRLIVGLSLGLIPLLGILSGASIEPGIETEEAFKSSLHHTGKGMAFWYDKANDGLEAETKVPYSKLACNQCHAASCEACHESALKKPAFEEPPPAVSEKKCLKCHDQLADLIATTRGTRWEDVHFARGMKCLDCHTRREMHGDGRSYSSLRQEGAMDARCENCHPALKQSTSHRKHKGKVHCLACHTGRMTHRLDYQFEPLAREGKRIFNPASDWIFLVEFNQKLMAAKLEAFVLPENRAYLMFSPYNSHVIMKKGRRCNECHASRVIRELDKVATIQLLPAKGDIPEKFQGLIPVTEGADLELEVKKFEKGTWVPLGNPGETTTQVIGYGDFITERQYKKLKKEKRD